MEKTYSLYKNHLTLFSFAMERAYT